MKAAWSHREPDTFFLSTLAVYGDRVYGASCQIDIVDKFGYVFAADARTGKVIWKKPSARSGLMKMKRAFINWLKIM